VTIVSKMKLTFTNKWLNFARSELAGWNILGFIILLLSKALIQFVQIQFNSRSFVRVSESLIEITIKLFVFNVGS